MKICPKCKKPHSKSGTFCSRTCANSRVRTEEIKRKTSETLKGRPSPIKGRLTTKRIISKCFICGSPITIPITKLDKNITCKSESCLKALKHEAGKKSASKRIKRSKDEIKLFELCKNEFENVFSNKIITDGWDADIVIEDYKVAILWNGPWHYRQMSLKNHSLLQVQNRDNIKSQLFRELGWTVLVFEDRFYTPSSAFEELVGMLRVELR